MGCDKRSYMVNNAVKAIVVRPIQRALVTQCKNDRDGWKLKSGAARATRVFKASRTSNQLD